MKRRACATRCSLSVSLPLTLSSSLPLGLDYAFTAQTAVACQEVRADRLDYSVTHCNKLLIN